MCACMHACVHMHVVYMVCACIQCVYGVCIHVCMHMHVNVSGQNSQILGLKGMILFRGLQMVLE